MGIDQKVMENMEIITAPAWRKWLVRKGFSVFQGFPYSMCKIGKLSFVAGAEIPQRYLVT
jgi:hypothetical protein